MVTNIKSILAISLIMGPLISAVGLSEAFAQTQEIRGRACVITASAACASEGFAVGNCWAFRYSPPNALGNGNSTRLSLFLGEYTVNYQQEGSAIGAVYKTPRFSFIGSGGGTNPTPLTKWRIPLVQPANYSQPYVHMLVDIFRFSDFAPDDPSLCNIRLRLTGQKRPDQLPSSALEASPVPALEDGLPLR